MYSWCCSDGRMVFSTLVIIFLFLKSWGLVPILRSIQYVTFKYGDFREPSICINYYKYTTYTYHFSGIYSSVESHSHRLFVIVQQ